MTARPTAGRALPLLLLALLLLLSAGAAYWFLLRGKALKPPPPEETCQLDITDITVNLADTDRPHYLYASVSLVIVGIDPAQAVEQRESQIRDAVIMVMTQQTYSELLSPEGKAGLKEDIRQAVENALGAGEPREGPRPAVRDVLFTSFLMD